MDQTLIGRENEVRALSRSLRGGAVVSVVGLPGVGKSRVARAALRELPPTSRIEHIELDGARTVADIAARICRVRREPAPSPTIDEDGVAFMLSRRPGIVLFDDADDAIGPLSTILERFASSHLPGSACAITSCRRTGLASETVLRIAPLAVPDAETDASALEDYEAVQLFLAELQRRSEPRAAARDFAAAARIVVRLEGLPLAIVRAAAVGVVVGLEELERLLAADGFEDLASDERGTRPRHRTIREAFDALWRSIDGADLRQFAAQLAAFRGSFSARAAAAITGCPMTTCVSHLAALSERSIVLSEGDATSVTFRYPGAIRLRAREELDAAPDRAHTIARLVEYFAEDSDASRALTSATPRRIEHATAGAALDHALDLGMPDHAARIVIGMAPVYLADGPLGDYVRLLRTVSGTGRARRLSPSRSGTLALLTGLALLFSGDRESSFAPFQKAARLAGAPDRAMALSYMGLVCGLSGDFSRARTFLTDARAAIGSSVAPLIEARVLKNVANVLAEEGDEGALEVIIRAAECFKRGGDLRGEGFMTLMRASFLLDRNRLQQAGVWAREASSMLTRAGDSRSSAWTACILATIDRDSGHLELAREAYRRSTHALRAVGDRQTLGIVLQLWAALELELRNPTNASKLCTEAERLLEAAEDNEHLAMVRALLGAAFAMDGHEEAARGSFARARATLPPRGRAARRTALAILSLTIATPAEQERALAVGTDPGDSEEVRSAFRILKTCARRGSQRPAGEVLRIAQDCRWLVTTGGELIELDRKPILRRLLELLVRERENAPGTPVTVAHLLKKGWPNQRVQHEAALNRLYVALARLRTLGLEPVLEKNAAGYLIRPNVSIERSAERPGSRS